MAMKIKTVKSEYVDAILIHTEKWRANFAFNAVKLWSSRNFRFRWWERNAIERWIQINTPWVFLVFVEKLPPSQQTQFVWTERDEDENTLMGRSKYASDPN